MVPYSIKLTMMESTTFFKGKLSSLSFVSLANKRRRQQELIDFIKE